MKGDLFRLGVFLAILVATWIIVYGFGSRDGFRQGWDSYDYQYGSKVGRCPDNEVQP